MAGLKRRLLTSKRKYVLADLPAPEFPAACTQEKQCPNVNKVAPEFAAACTQESPILP